MHFTGSPTRSQMTLSRHLGARSSSTKLVKSASETLLLLNHFINSTLSNPCIHEHFRFKIIDHCCEEWTIIPVLCNSKSTPKWGPFLSLAPTRRFLLQLSREQSYGTMSAIPKATRYVATVVSTKMQKSCVVVVEKM